jgi:hypothetical protein
MTTRVARLGPGEDRGDRSTAVGLGRDPARRATSPARTDEDLVDDRLWTLRARVVRGDPDLVAQPSRDLAHDRPLGAVAIAAAAEDDRQPPAGQLARRREHTLERVRRVRVVDDNEKRLTGPHLLEAPGHGADGAERLRDRGRLEAQAEPGRHGAEQIHHVVLADERRRQGHATARRLDGHPDAVDRRGVLDRPHAGTGAETEREHVHREPLHHRWPGRIVGVDHRRAPGLRRIGQQLEQPALGEPVVLERAVEVQMVLRQVREHRHVEREPSARASASAWDETSIATPRTPRSRMWASIACRSSASGVV